MENSDRIIITIIIFIIVLSISIFSGFMQYNPNSCSEFKKIKYISHELTSKGDFSMKFLNGNETLKINKIEIGFIELNSDKYTIDKNVMISIYGKNGPLGHGNYEYNISILYDLFVDIALCKGRFT